VSGITRGMTEGLKNEEKEIFMPICCAGPAPLVECCKWIFLNTGLLFTKMRLDSSTSTYVRTVVVVFVPIIERAPSGTVVFSTDRVTT